MKKLLFLLLLFISNLTYSQFSAGGGIGWSSKKSAIADLNIRYQVGNVFIGTGYLTHISNHTDKGTIFNIVGGYNINLDEDEQWSLQPQIGYFIHLRTNNDKLKNTSGLITSVYLLKSISNNGQLFLSANLADRIFLTSFGLRYSFKK